MLSHFDRIVNVKSRDETENIRAVVEMKMEGGVLEKDRSCGGKTLKMERSLDPLPHARRRGER